MGQSDYTLAEMDEADRVSLAPFELSLGASTATTGLTWSVGIDNKIDVSVDATVAPVGFDLYTTAQGSAIRFIGTGLGNGDVVRFELLSSFSISVGTGQGTVLFKAKTRPYTEALFTNAVDIPYVAAERRFSNNDVGNTSLSPQIITLSDGDLVEFSANPDANLSNVDITTVGVLLREA